MKTTWISLGLGIIFFSILISGAVWFSKRFVIYSIRAPSSAPLIQCDASDLARTTVTPVLPHPLHKDTNIIWCATAPVVWNEFKAMADGPLFGEKDHPWITLLNENPISKRVLDDSTYISRTGFSSDVGQLRNDMLEKFSTAPTPSMLPDDTLFFAYTYMHNIMPFVDKFWRRTSGLRFEETRVEAFGFDDSNDGESRFSDVTGQVLVWSYKNSDNFTIELVTESKDHHLILARLPRAQTLQEAIRNTLDELAEEPERGRSRDDLAIPLINFDIVRDYHEIAGQHLYTANGNRFTPLDQFRQQIRFSLDETGALLISEASAVVFSAPSEKRYLHFDGPFLVLLRYKQAQWPYLAIWIENTELLINKGSNSTQRKNYTLWNMMTGEEPF